MNYGNGFFYLAEIGDFRLAQNGCFHLALTIGAMLEMLDLSEKIYNLMTFGIN